MIISNWKKTFGLYVCVKVFQRFNPFKPEFFIFIHYKPRIAVAILHL